MYKFPINGKGGGPGRCLSLEYFLAKSNKEIMSVAAIIDVKTPVKERSDIKSDMISAIIALILHRLSFDFSKTIMFFNLMSKLLVNDNHTILD